MAFTDKIVNVLVMHKGRLKAVNGRSVPNVGGGGGEGGGLNDSTLGQCERRMKLCNSQ